MHLPEFVLLVLATIAAIAAGLAVLASRFGIARVLFWVAALSFWSLGVLWSATSKGYSLPTQMIVAGIIGGIAAAGLAFVLWEIREKEKIEEQRTSQAAEVPTPTPAQPAMRGPTLEATRNSTIDATGAVIPGDLPFQLGKADDRSVIDMAGINVTRKDDGTITITPGNVPKAFPPPTGEFSSLSNAELKERARAISSDLRALQRRFEEDARKLTRLPQGGIEDHEFKAFSEKYYSEYQEGFAKGALSIASELLARLGTATATSRGARSGGGMLLYGAFAGPTPASDVAEFLDSLTQQLSDNALH
jgi:hypothetical protein